MPLAADTESLPPEHNQTKDLTRKAHLTSAVNDTVKGAKSIARLHLDRRHGCHHRPGPEPDPAAVGDELRALLEAVSRLAPDR